MDIFQICAGEPDAVPNTHAIITATAPATSSSASDVDVASVVIASAEETGLSSRSTTKTSSSSETLSSASTSRTARQTFPAPTISSTNTPAATSPEPTVLAQTTSSAQPSGKSLTTSQAVGISVAGAATVGLACAAVFLFCQRRRRKVKREDDTVGFKIMPSPSLAQDGRFPPPPPRSKSYLRGRTGPSLPSNPASTKTKERWSTWRRTPKTEQTLSPELKSLQQTPATSTPTVFRTNSKLLPDKPVFNPQATSQPMPVYARPQSEATVFDDDNMSLDGETMPDSSCRTSVNCDGPRLMLNGNALGIQQIQDQSTIKGVTRPAFAQPTAGLRPYNPHQPHPRIVTSNISNGRNRRSRSGGPTSNLIHLYESPRDASARYSNGSVTSFESLDEEDDDKQHLSPVKETRLEEDEDTSSPISPSKLKYPRVPRSLSGQNYIPYRPPMDRNNTFGQQGTTMVPTVQALAQARVSPRPSEQRVAQQPPSGRRKEVKRPRKAPNDSREQYRKAPGVSARKQ
ncbi:MAG: hypothetical protein M1833_001355 [Piccolia ochrophora]|nr:MAG: hypothetical protein M1833_001355 [Piccolia ochrophora]